MLNTIKQNIVISIISIIGICAFMFVLVRAANAPVIFQVYPDGEVCGCGVNGNMPTLSQCHLVDKNKLHEVIYVKSCEEGK